MVVVEMDDFYRPDAERFEPHYDLERLTAQVLGPLAAFIVWSGLKGYAESVKRSASWV